MPSVYKCKGCGNFFEGLYVKSECIPKCCGELMDVLEEKTAEMAKEKHVPVIEKIDGGFYVKVGSTPHPMKEEHFIILIQLIEGEKEITAYLEGKTVAEATFICDFKDPLAREICNKHGLWVSQKFSAQV